MDLQYILSEERREGRAEGLAEGRLEIAKKMLLGGFAMEQVINMTDLSEAEALEVKQSLAL
mgnify:FL=1